MAHAPSLVMLIAPENFRPNPETAADNAFVVQGGDADALAHAAQAQHRALCEGLAGAGVRTIVLPGTRAALPDEVFLNNWFSTHEDADGRGRAVIYPLRWPSRRKERRPEIIAALRRHYRELLDLSPFESKEKFLESTGSLVFDGRLARVYAARSPRTDEELVRFVAYRLGYEPVVFDTMGLGGRPLYHTNVMMFLGTGVAVACLDVVPPVQRRALEAYLCEGRELVTLAEAQVNEFAGNGFEMTDAKGEPVLTISDRAYKSLAGEQLATLHKYYGDRIVHPLFDAIEQGGGSVRCTLAALHTSRPDDLVRALQAYR
ncbi:MAG: arginine deiminase-related protein [Alphaproteobacteria bacterium]